MDICIDFDGTCVTHEFPNIGADIGAIPVLKKIVENGHNIILFTMRSDMKDISSNDYNINTVADNYLSQALEWFKENKITLYGINTNPTQHLWTESPKAYGQLYIDDLSIGCPLIYNQQLSKHPFVDWCKIEEILSNNGIIN